KVTFGAPPDQYGNRPRCVGRPRVDTGWCDRELWSSLYCHAIWHRYSHEGQRARPSTQRFNDAMHGEQSAPGAGIPIFSNAQSNTDGSNSHISQPEWLRAASEPGDRRVGSGVCSHERSKRVSIQFDVMSRSDSWENITRFARDPERAARREFNLR